MVPPVVPMRLLTSVHGSFPARVVAARLEAEGLDVELRGAVHSPYVLTMGEMSRVELWVPEDQLDDGRLVLLACEVDDAMARPRAIPAPTGRRRAGAWAAIAAVVATAAAAPVVRLLLA